MLFERVSLTVPVCLSVCAAPSLGPGSGRIERKQGWGWGPDVPADGSSEAGETSPPCPMTRNNKYKADSIRYSCGESLKNSSELQQTLFIHLYVKCN